MLMDEDGLRISTHSISTPLGDFNLAEVDAANSRSTKPLYGPLLLALLGTLNLVIAFRSHFWLDFVASGLMLGGGLFWRASGTQHVLMLKTGGGEVDAWFTRRDAQMQRALEIIRARLGVAQASNSH